MPIVPYIGITDFMTFEQVKQMLAVFKAHLPPGSKRRLHVGVMMSCKTLRGIESKWSEAFPTKETIADIFGCDETYNCLHYADYDRDPRFWKNLSRAISYGGIGIHAVQLDMTWPDPGQIAHGIHTSRKEVEIVLQIGTKAMQEAGGGPAGVVRKLENYEGLIHRVLLDKSIGRGLDMDAAYLIPFARAIKKRFPCLGLVAAGGLGPDTMHLIKPFLKEFPDSSMDAQGKLRPSGSALDPIDWGMAEKYLVGALELFK